MMVLGCVMVSRITVDVGTLAEQAERLDALCAIALEVSGLHECLEVMIGEIARLAEEHHRAVTAYEKVVLQAT